MGKYRAGAVSGISFTLACLACLGGGLWSHWRASGGMYIAGAALGGLAAFIATTVRHGGRSSSRGTTGALASMAFGWAAAIAAFTFTVVCYVLAVFALLALSGSPVTG